MAKHAKRPGFYTFAQIMSRHGMSVTLAKRIYMAGWDI